MLQGYCRMCDQKGTFRCSKCGLAHYCSRGEGPSLAFNSQLLMIIGLLRLLAYVVGDVEGCDYACPDFLMALGWRCACRVPEEGLEDAQEDLPCSRRGAGGEEMTGPGTCSKRTTYTTVHAGWDS